MADAGPARARGRGRMARVVELAGHDQLHGRSLAIGTAGLAALVVGIGVVDSMTGSSLSFGVFYLVPVTVAAAIGGTRAGTAFAGLAAVVWVIADRAIGDDDPAPWIDLLNVALRFSILGFVVVLLAATRDALRTARASDRRSREFLAFAAHQLRTPTTSVSATAQNLLALGQEAEHEEALVRIVSESNRIGRLVASVLHFVRLDQGDPMPRRHIDVGRLCAAEVERHSDPSGAVRVGLDVDPDASLVGDASPEALQEALGNLLDNATRHARTSVTVSVAHHGRVIEVRVVDDGPGLPGGAEEHAFEPFVTLHDHAGSGLGLPIARRLIDAQGGSLVYHAGAFVLTVPAAR